ncbi:MAG: ROK family protein [Lachnospiraceae bacterium]
MAKKYNICLDIGGTKILGVIFDQDKNIVYRIKKKTKKDGDSTDNVEKVIISVVEEMLEESGISKKEVAAIAAGAPGVIDQAKGIILFSPNLPWRNYDIKSSMEKKFGVPFYIGNDVNVGVLGEYKYGAARGYKDVVGFFVGTGMGGGVIEAAGQTFLEKIEAEVDRYCMPSIRDTVELKIAELGDDSNIYGALAMIEEMNK